MSRNSTIPTVTFTLLFALGCSVIARLRFPNWWNPHGRQLLLDTDALGPNMYQDPRTISLRVPEPLEPVFTLNALLQPDGYPWHRWANITHTNYPNYPLNTRKFLHILSRLGSGENHLAKDILPIDYTTHRVTLHPNMPRMHGFVQVYLVRNGTVLRPKGRTGAFVSLLQRAIEKAKSTQQSDIPTPTIPRTSDTHRKHRMKLLTQGDFPLLFDPNDYPWCGDDLVPVFRLNAIRSANDCQHSWPVLSLTYFSDPSNIPLTRSPQHWDDIQTRWDHLYPWKNKISKVVWRGRLTGYTYPQGERPRQKLVEYAKRFGDIMDIQAAEYGKENGMKQEDFQRYKAILDIDGNAWSARLGKLLCMNSVVIKVEPTYVGYWEKELQAWVHYLPVKADLSDLETIVRYAVDPNNNERIQSIVKNSQVFCRTKLTIEQYTIDLLWTVLAYAELLSNSPNFYNEWKNDWNAYNMPALQMKAWAGGKEILS